MNQSTELKIYKLRIKYTGMPEFFEARFIQPPSQGIERKQEKEKKQEKEERKEVPVVQLEDVEERPFFGEFTGADLEETTHEFRKPTVEEEKWFKERVKRISEIFENADFLWYLDGAINISLYGDKQIRAHKDIDISVFREDLDKVEKLLRKEGFAIFINFEKNSKKFMKKVTVEELTTLDNPDLSICKVDPDGKIQKESADPFNFTDLHVHRRDAEGNTIISYNEVTLPKEYFEPIKKELPNGKKINLSQPAIVAYHKLHSDRPHDFKDLEKLRPYLQEKDFTMLRESLKREIEEKKRKIKEKLQELWGFLSPLLEFTHDQKVISEKLWEHSELQKLRDNRTASEYVSSISRYISEKPDITFDDFLNQSMTILKLEEWAEQKLKSIDQLEFERG